jgi:hypothetical protein
MNFHEIWYEHHATRGHPTFVLISLPFVNTILADVRTLVLAYGILKFVRSIFKNYATFSEQKYMFGGGGISSGGS